MKYADCPTVTVSTEIVASPAGVWELVSDIELSSRFSTEVSGAEWIDGADGPALDARFVGHSAHDAIGEWTTTCIVTGFEDDRVFEWSVIGRDGDVSSIWRYTIDDLGTGAIRLEYWFQMGPGRGGLNHAIDRMPDKEERIVARRLDEHESNMQRMLAGIKDLAESTGGVGGG
jgi:Polyketide cyclase / dehydrase and lipid transport